MWNRSPFEAFIDGDWMYGRGAGDMKAGLASNLFAIQALKHLGLRPAADVFFQSVVEEECTGNCALACMQRGYRADAALIPEPFAEKLVSSQVGVIWFEVHLKGLPTHVAYAGWGANAIEAAIPLFEALHRLEQQMNAVECRHHDYVGHKRANVWRRSRTPRSPVVASHGN
nr:M20/M25/M40 family metallo-hydrolase [Sinorhizobium meliloti]